ncbi:hypothetical protein L2E82_07853 [Cichorium intybus]|uniref:Uncharacterized protein n=1 Tax=Cichorium intybus TaxID=13427 RepID=A0ACB9G501_CICIN|nr:hypothetical protein L2E82_07853 [Cichorium intybus]
MEGCNQSKVFVGGISWETTENVLREHFGKYGKVIDAAIAKDRITVEVKKAVPRSEHIQNHQEPNINKRTNGVINNKNIKIKKIFVGGLPANITEDEFKVYFEKFGKITDVVVMHDNITRKPRGFGFITFDSKDSLEQVMQKSFHELCGKLVEVKRAVPKEDGGNGIINSYSGGNGISNSYSGGNGISNSYSGGNGIGIYLPCRPRYDVVPFYGGYGYGYYGGIRYGLGPWGPYPVTIFPTYGYGYNGKPSQLSEEYGAGSEISR